MRNLINKKGLLEKEAEKIRKCRHCQRGKIGKAVPGEGNADAQIVFVGEAPGKEEAKTGRPFVGRSGKFLRHLIRRIGLKEEEVYITSPVKYLPKRGTPSKSDIIHGASHLNRQLAIINPKIIVLLGNIAYKALIDQSPAVNSHHGKVITRDGQKYFITFHPAAALRFPRTRSLMIKDFHKLKKLIILEN